MDKRELLDELEKIIKEDFGERCEEYEDTCVVCRVWFLLDTLKSYLDYDEEEWQEPQREVILGIPVCISQEEDGSFMVADYEIDMYGVGDTEEEAKRDYKNVVREYFVILEEHKNHLGGRLQEHYNYLLDRKRKGIPLF